MWGVLKTSRTHLNFSFLIVNKCMRKTFSDYRSACFLCLNVCLQPFVGTAATSSESIPASVAGIGEVNTWCQRHNPTKTQGEISLDMNKAHSRHSSIMHSHSSGNHDMPGGAPDFAKELSQSVFWSVTACLILAQQDDGMIAAGMTDWLMSTAHGTLGVLEVAGMCLYAACCTCNYVVFEVGTYLHSWNDHTWHDFMAETFISFTPGGSRYRW